VWRVTLRGLAAKKFRLVLTSLAVVLGVAFMAGTFVLTDTLGNVFDSLFETTTRGVDAVARAKEPFEASNEQGGGENTRPPVPDSLVDVVRDVPGVDLAQGNLAGYALVIGKDGEAVINNRGAPALGLPWYPRNRTVNESLELARGRQPRAPNEVALDIKTMQEGKFKLGDKVKISFSTVEPQKFDLVGTFLFGGKENALAGATLAAFEPTAAQELMNRSGQWDLVEARAESGLSQTELKGRIAKALREEGLNKDYQTLTGDELAKEQADDIKSNLSFFNTFLLIFAVVALFVGAFVIYNTFSITIAQRIRELGLLRALGASGKQVTGSVLVESFTVGALSSMLGILLGIAIVKPLEALLSAFGIDLPSGPLQILPRTIIVSFIVGTGVTVLSSLSPARRASRIAPIAALRDQAYDAASGRRRYIWGAVVLVLAIVSLAMGLFGGASPLLVGVGALLTFIAVSMLSPLVAAPAARLLTAPATRTHAITGVLARENAERNPRRTASTAAALMIGLALVSAVAILAASAKSSFRSAIEDQTTADFILSSSTFNGFSPEAANQVREKLPGSTVVQYRFGTFEIGSDATSVFGASPNFWKMSDVGIQPGTRKSAFNNGGVLVFKDEAESKGYKVGDTVDVTFPDGPGTVTVQGIFDDKKALPSSSDYILSLADWDRFPDQFDFYVGVIKPEGVSTAKAERVINRIADGIGGIEADNKAGFIDRQLAQFNQILNLMYVLLLLAVVIALVGIVNTLALSIYERTREIGLLRAVGMSRVQLRRMIRGEALIVATFGSLLGLGIGLVFGFLLIQALSEDGVSLTVPFVQLVIFVILAGLAGLLAGVPPARRAARLDILRAIHSE
jgi:putative ABC transport system permease protein